MQSPRLLGQIIRKQFIPRRSVHYDSHHPVTTYNDLPSPQGSWKTHYDANQRKYNAHLLIGIGCLTATVIFGSASGLVDGHDDIPERPADIPSYK